MNTQPIKLLATTLLAGSLLLTSCSINGFTFGGKPLFGSGVSMTESRPVNDVSSVSSYGSGDLIVEHGETEALTITADDNILPYLTSDVSGGHLSLGTKPNTSIMSLSGVVYRLTVKKLDGVEVAGSGSSTVNGVAADRFSVKSTGSGSITVNGKATHQDVTLTGSGSYTADQLNSATASVRSFGSGSIVVRVAEKLEGDLNGSGSIDYYGDPTVNVTIHGSGRTNHR